MSLINSILFGGHGATTRFGDIGLAISRICTGAFIAIGHGYGKLFHDGGFGPTSGFIESTGKMGFPAPTLFAWMAALTEFLGGILLALGLLTRPTAFFLAGNMAVAAFVAHAKNDWFGSPPNKEYALLFLVPALMLVFTGGGRYSIDSFLRRK